MKKVFLKTKTNYKDFGVHFSHLLSYPMESHPDFKEKRTAVTFHWSSDSKDLGQKIKSIL